jgi:hypothetical protein
MREVISEAIREVISEAIREVISEAIRQVMGVRARRPFGCHSDWGGHQRSHQGSHQRHQRTSSQAIRMPFGLGKVIREVISVISVRARRPFGCHSDQLLVRGGRGEHTAPEEELAAQRQRRPPLLVLVVRHVPNDSGAVAARDVVKGVLDALHRMPGWHITRRVERT